MSSALSFQKMSQEYCVAPQAIKNNASFSCLATDTNGCKAVHFRMFMGATDIAFSALKIQESDTLTNTTTLASGTDITGADFSVSPATVPSATDDNKYFVVTIPVTGARKRYLNAVITVGNGATGGFAFAEWFKEAKDEAPNTATKRGISQHPIIAG